MQKIIKHIYKGFSDQLKLNIDINSKDGVQKIIKHLDSLDPKLFQSINEYESVLINIDFFKKEKEMAIKFPEMWEMQVNQTKELADAVKTKLIDLASQHKVDLQIVFDEFDNLKLSLEDFENII